MPPCLQGNAKSTISTPTGFQEGHKFYQRVNRPRTAGAQKQVLLVADEAIRAAQLALWDVCRIVAEPGGAAPLAALLEGVYRPARNEKVAVIVSGGNTTAVDFAH